ncbi:MAG: head-tail connector protein [Clostridium sp.]|nr:head-tail connector protein [Clostridium sp.]
MIELAEMKEWLRIFHDEEDNLIISLIASSISIIKSATGITKDYILSCKNDVVIDLYKMVQRILITDLYNERDTENKALTSFYIQLELAYKEALINENR